MAFKLKTSKKTEEIFERIEASENMPCYILAKLAIALSLRSEKTLEEKDFFTNSMGRELNRQTITAEWDDLYKCLISMSEKRHLEDDEYFQKYIKAHLDRGAVMLYGEYKYNNDFLLGLLSDKQGL